MAQERILIVDGDVTSSQILKMRLEAMGYLVDCVGSGRRALDILKSRWIDLIILSIVLRGGIHGYGVLKEIKKKKKFAKIPIIMQSSKPAMRKTFERLGACAFFIKPYAMDAFLSKVNEIITKKGD